MKKIKIYFQDKNRNEEEMKKVVEAIAGNRGFEALVEIPGKNRDILPLGFDLYLLYATEVNLSRVQKLRENQPGSFFVGRFGGGLPTQEYPDFSPYFDRTYTYLSSEDCDEIFNMIKKSRGEK